MVDQTAHTSRYELFSKQKFLEKQTYVVYFYNLSLSIISLKWYTVFKKLRWKHGLGRVVDS